jgi:hypothetical protein
VTAASATATLSADVQLMLRTAILAEERPQQPPMAVWLAPRRRRAAMAASRMGLRMFVLTSRGVAG